MMDLATLRDRFEESSTRADELLDEASDLWNEAANAVEDGERITFAQLMREASSRLAIVAVLYEALARECDCMGHRVATAKPS